MPNPFVAGGTLSPDHPSYIPRIVAKEFCQACLDNHYTYIFTARQVGKSSLVIDLKRQLQQDRDVVVIDLSYVGNSFKDIDDWYFNILSSIIKELNFELDLETWWDTHARLMPNSRFNNFLEEKLLPQIKQALVLFLDEIDTMLELSFTNEVMANIRALYNARSQNNIFQKLTISMVGVATPEELINNPLKTPFNLGQRFELVDFTYAELENYRLELVKQHPQYGNKYFADIFEWVQGHPYLTQKLCQLAYDAPKNSGGELVETLIRNISQHETHEFNIPFVRDALVKHPMAEAMLNIYLQITLGTSIKDNINSFPINRLKLTGIVVVKQGYLQIRNKLYQTIFDFDWTQQELRERLLISEKSQKDKLVEQLQEAEAKIKWLEANLKVIDDEIRQLQGEVTAKTKQVEQLQGMVTANQSQIKELQGEVATAKEQIDQILNDLAAKITQIKNLQSEITIQTKHIEQLQNSLTAKAEQIKQLQANTTKKIHELQNNLDIKEKHIRNTTIFIYFITFIAFMMAIIKFFIV